MYVQPFDATSPETLYLVQIRLGLLGYNVVGGEIQGVPQSMQDYVASNLAANIPMYFFLDRGERFWEDHMNQMMDKTVVKEMVRAQNKARLHVSRGVIRENEPDPMML